MYRHLEKNLLSSNTSSTCLDNMVNFGPLTAEIGSGVWGTPTNFKPYCIISANIVFRSDASRKIREILIRQRPVET